MKIFDQLVFRLQLIIASDCPRSRHQRDFFIGLVERPWSIKIGGEFPRLYARMAELAYAADLKSVDICHTGSIPVPGTIINHKRNDIHV